MERSTICSHIQNLPNPAEPVRYANKPGRTLGEMVEMIRGNQAEPWGDSKEREREDSKEREKGENRESVARINNLSAFSEFSSFLSLLFFFLYFIDN